MVIVFPQAPGSGLYEACLWDFKEAVDDANWTAECTFQEVFNLKLKKKKQHNKK